MGHSKTSYTLTALCLLSIISLAINQAPHNLLVSLSFLAFSTAIALSPKDYLNGLSKHKFLYTSLGLYLGLYLILNFLHLGGAKEDLIYALRRGRWVVFALIFLPFSEKIYLAVKKSPFQKAFIYALSMLSVLIIYDSLSRFIWLEPTTSLWIKSSLTNNFGARAAWTYNPIPFSKIALFVASIFVMYSHHSTSKTKTLITGSFALSMALVSLLSLTRATWLGLLLIFLLTLVRLKSLKLMIAGSALASIAALVCILSPTLNERLQSATSTKSYSTRYRVEHFKANLKLIQNNPLGVGYASNRKQDVMKPYMVEFHKNPNRVYGKHPHNEYLDVASGMGLISLVLFLVVLLYPVFFKLKSVGFFNLSLTEFIPLAFVLCIYVTAAFDKITYTTWTTVLFSWALLLGSPCAEKTQKPV